MTNLPEEHKATTRNRVFRVAFRVFQFLWLSACMAVLVIYLRTRASATDADIFLGYAMIALSYPLGSIVFGIQARLLDLANVHAGSIWMWAEMLIMGYVQWFVLLPLAIRVVRRRLSRAKSD